MREIGDAAGLNSPASVKYQLDILEEKGFIRRDENRGRAMEVVLPDHLTGDSASTDKTRFIPLVGSIAAGVPITADQQVEETLPLPESLVGKGDLFMLKVKGESMIEPLHMPSFQPFQFPHRSLNQLEMRQLMQLSLKFEAMIVRRCSLELAQQ